MTKKPPKRKPHSEDLYVTLCADGGDRWFALMTFCWDRKSALAEAKKLPGRVVKVRVTEVLRRAKAKKK